MSIRKESEDTFKDKIKKASHRNMYKIYYYTYMGTIALYPEFYATFEEAVKSAEELILSDHQIYAIRWNKRAR